jgi:prolycopene isomerase
LYPSLLKISGLTAKQLLETYISDKKLIAILSDIWRFIGLPASRVSAFYFLLVFRGYYYSPTAYVRGGFAQLFKAMVAQIRDSGSEVRFNTPAQKIISSKDKMVNAVITDKGEEIQTRVVISNANAVSTLAEMLDGAALKEQYARRLGSLEKSISAFQVYLGLGVPAKSLGMSEYMFSINTTYDHDADFACAASGDYERCSLELVDHAQVDPGLVPDGKGSLLIMCLDSYANWKGLSADEYRIKKEGAAQKLIARAEHYLPGLSRHIEVMEAATPLTVERFGSSPQGAIYGFAQTPSQTMIRRLSQEASVKGLFLAGAWTRPGAGVHACVISGIDAANLAAAYLRQP